MKTFLKLAVCLLVTNIASAQVNTHICYIVPDTSSPEAIGAGPNGKVFTPKGNLKVLTIFAGFNDGPDIPPTTNFQENGSVSGWTYDPNNPTIPDALMNDPDLWMYDDLNNFGNGKYNLSEYYSEMSGGQFKMYGDILKDPITNNYVRIDIDPTLYPGGGWDGMNRLVIDKMQQLYPNFDWSPYDNRTNWPNFQTDNSVSAPDSMPDYVVIIYRYNPKWGINGNPGNQPVSGMNGWSGSKGGISKLRINGTVNYNGYTFDDAGFTLCKGTDVPYKKLGLFIHEVAHELYSAPHQTGVNGVVGDYWNFPSVGWGMIGHSTQLNFTANAFDRWILGWIDLTTGVNQTNTDIQSINDIQNGGVYTLGDFVTTGDVVRIKIPNTEDEYLWLENHQSISQFDKKPWEGKNQSPNNELIAPQSLGLYMYKERINGDRDTVSTGLINTISSVNAIEMLNANGNFDYERSQYGVIDLNWYWGTPIFNFKRKRDNPLDGCSNYQNYPDDYPDTVVAGPSNGLITYWGYSNGGNSEAYPIIRENNGVNDVTTYANTGGLNTEAATQLGRRTDAFVTNDEVSLSGIVPAFNYPKYNIATAHKSPYIVNGLSVKVLSENIISGEITVQISLDDYDIRNDKSWAGNITLPANVQNAANYSLNLKANKTLSVVKSGTPNRHTLNTQNTPADFINNTYFECQSGSYFHLEANATLAIAEKSTMVLKSGSKLELEDGAELLIYEGELIIENGAELILHDGAKLTVDTDGKLTINNATTNKGLIVGDNTITTNQAEVVVNGNLTFSSSAIWEHKKSGFYNFSGSHTLNLPATVPVTFTGKSKTHKMLQISGGNLTLTGNTINFTSGLVYYGTNAEFILNNASYVGNVLTLKGAPSSPPNNIGLKANNPTKLHLINCTLEDLGKAVSINNATPMTLLLANTYTDNVIGVYLSAANYTKIASSTFSSSLSNAIGIKAVESNQVDVGSTTISTINKGAYFDNVSGAYFNNSNINYADVGIEAENSLVFIRTKTEIHQNNIGVEMYGSYNYTTNNYSSMLTVGDVGCGAIYNNTKGVYGRDLILNIDAIEHSINSSSNDTIPNRFDNNSTYTFDMCYTDYTVAPSQINAKMNYWGTSVIPPSNYRIKTNTDCIAKPNHGNNIPLITTPISTCTPTPNCMNCKMSGGSTNPPGGGSGGAIGLLVANSFQNANEPFVDEDNTITRQGFNSISAVGLLKDTLNDTWQGVSINNELVSLDKNSVHRIQVAKAISSNSTANARTVLEDIFAGYDNTMEDENSFDLFPNPAQNEINIVIDELNEVSFVIYNLLGKQVKTGKFKNRRKVNTTNLRGVYFIEIMKPNGKKTIKKFVVNN